ncbi:MBL fold metallo-hydrolase [Maritimibacter fusiformis]|uniref:MBL fold metallo-hydrolase n=1 Tax=Maritimibacter fusiformis TaxID=2603819 RepID=A0A5D0RL66_9RHOB|nr:MBL fold metallo-hydrolase [Maritimibacter fusiformis]TYB81274.1 MBL fold metallo-hydrolase [Maritimibacter fusiformis]
MTLIRPTRRDILKVAAAAPALAMPASARAMLGAPEGGNPAHFRFSLGEARVSIVSDGWFAQPMSGIAINAPEDEKLAAIAANYIAPDANYAHTNHVYVETGEARVLIDVGSGSRFLPTAGRLVANLEAAGIDPYGITHVVITHAHPDHIWGIRDDFDEPLVPDAEYVIGAAEHAYWLQDGLVDRVAPEDQQFVVGAVNSLSAEGVEWTLAEDGAEVAPGVRLVASPGHTAGHMSVMITSGDEALLAFGDALTHAWFNFDHPGWVIAADADPEGTVASRLRLLDMAASERIATVGYHFPFPGVGHVTKIDGRFRFVPALWQF